VEPLHNEQRPNCDIDAVRRDDMQQMSSSINEISEALSKAQSELESANKDQSGYGYNYSDLATVIKTAKPVLAKHNLAVTQLVAVSSSGDPAVTTLLVHSSGQYFRSYASMPAVEMKGCNIAQQSGATLSYLRRYAYQAILGMSSEDNDASSSGFSNSSSSQKKQPQKFRKKADSVSQNKEELDEL